MGKSITSEVGPQKQFSRLFARHGLARSDGRLEELLKLGLVIGSYEGEADAGNLGARSCGFGGSWLRGRAAERIRHLRRCHTRGLGKLLRGRRRLLLLLLLLKARWLRLEAALWLLEARRLRLEA